MSRCISRHGEFSEHDLDANFTCRLCLDVDTDALLAERDALAATVDRVRALCDEHRSMYPEDAPSVLVRDLDAVLAGHTDGDHTTHTDTADRGGDRG